MFLTPDRIAGSDFSVSNINSCCNCLLLTFQSFQMHNLIRCLHDVGPPHNVSQRERLICSAAPQYCPFEDYPDAGQCIVEGDPVHSRQWVGSTPIRHLVFASHQPPRIWQHGQTNAYTPLLSMTASSRSLSNGATEIWCHSGKFGASDSLFQGSSRMHAGIFGYPVRVSMHCTK